MIPVMSRMWMPGGGGCQSVGAYEYPTHLFMFDDDFGTAGSPLDSIGNATGYTNSGVWYSGGFTVTNCYPPDGGVAAPVQTSSNYIRFSSIDNWADFKGSWTWECFYVASSNSTTQRILGYGSNSWDNNGGACWLINGSNRFSLYQPGHLDLADAYHSPARDTEWRHGAVCFDGTYVYFAYDGVISKSASTTLTSTITAEIYQIGGAGGGIVTDRGVHGIDCLRITHGAALYTGSNGTTYNIPTLLGFDNSIP